jgi:hypothetical protein
MLAAEGLRPISSAAPATLPVRATASNTAIWRKVIRTWLLECFQSRWIHLLSRKTC